MNLFFYRGAKPNFGDELNTWMWPRLVDGLFDKDDHSIFLGIGSIIWDSFPAHKKKIVFGSGFGGYTSPPTIDDSWKFYFVRGRLTAKTLGINTALGVGDAAIMLRSCVKTYPKKRFKVSFMPHWQTDGNWKAACQAASIHYIDPCGEVETVLDELLASELVLTEAMHGAIVSDALRVPWIPIKPIQSNHRWKWFDWASALDIDLKPVSVAGSSLLESTIQVLSYPMLAGSMSSVVKKLNNNGRAHRTLKKISPEFFMERAAESLLSISHKNYPSLSSDAAIEKAHSTMLGQLDQIIADTGHGKVIY